MIRLGFAPGGGLLMAAAGALVIRARRWLSLAGRSRVGVRSEDEVQRALARLVEDGWRLRHGARWSGPGDIDSLAIAPTGVGFAIETKTATYDERHLSRVIEQATWITRRRLRWCRRGAFPVLCVVCAAGVERWDRDVLVVPIDRLVPALRQVADFVEARSVDPTRRNARGVERRR